MCFLLRSMKRSDMPFGPLENAHAPRTMVELVNEVRLVEVRTSADLAVFALSVQLLQRPTVIHLLHRFVFRRSPQLLPPPAGGRWCRHVNDQAVVRSAPPHDFSNNADSTEQMYTVCVSFSLCSILHDKT